MKLIFATLSWETERVEPGDDDKSSDSSQDRNWV